MPSGISACAKFLVRRGNACEIADMIRAVAAEGCDAIVILCTNLDGAGITAALERELNVLVLDSVAVTLWRTMVLAGADPRVLSGWGRVFQLPVP